jgi:hypothetical protein
MDQARARKGDADLGNRLTGQAFGLLGRCAVLTTDQAERARLVATLYTSLLPAVEARLFSLERLHAAGLMKPEEGSAGIVQTSGVPGAR